MKFLLTFILFTSIIKEQEIEQKPFLFKTTDYLTYSVISGILSPYKIV